MRWAVVPTAGRRRARVGSRPEGRAADRPGGATARPGGGPVRRGYLYESRVLVDDPSPGNRSATYNLECAHEDVSGPCWARSPVVADRNALEAWAVAHTWSTNGLHTQFDEHARRPRKTCKPNPTRRGNADA
ncbi:DUF7848 domain-containing protein [Streptomyces rimosus]